MQRMTIINARKQHEYEMLATKQTNDRMSADAKINSRPLQRRRLRCRRTGPETSIAAVPVSAAVASML